MNEERKMFGELNDTEFIATTRLLPSLNIMIGTITLSIPDRMFEKTKYEMVCADHCTFMKYISELYSLAKKEDDSIPAKARVGIMTGTFLTKIISPIDYPVLDTKDYELGIKRNIEYINNLVDDGGRYLGILGISDRYVFDEAVEDAIFKGNRELAEKEFLKLSKSRQDKIRLVIKNNNDFYEYLGFHPIYSDGFIGYSNYVYGDIGEKLSIISKRLIRKGEKLF